MATSLSPRVCSNGNGPLVKAASRGDRGLTGGPNANQQLKCSTERTETPAMNETTATADSCTAPDFCPAYPPAQRCRGCLLRHVTKQRDDLLAALEVVEWSWWPNGHRHCGCCGRDEDDGHNAVCRVGAALKKAKGL